MHTGICPDDPQDIKQSRRNCDTEKVIAFVPKPENIIQPGGDGYEFEEHDGQWYVVVYTDGSLYDGDAEYFTRGGWGFYVGKDHCANYYKPLDTSEPTTFRAELRAILHAFQCAAMPVLVRSDCKGACKLAQNILDGKGFDYRHPDKDILETIQWYAQNVNIQRIIRWMPAHLDEEDNHKKKAKYLKSGGTEEHILGNCAADALAKKGADVNIKDQEAYDRYVNRRALTRATQDFMVDVWRAEIRLVSRLRSSHRRKPF